MGVGDERIKESLLEEEAAKLRSSDKNHLMESNKQQLSARHSTAEGWGKSHSDRDSRSTRGGLKRAVTVSGAEQEEWNTAVAAAMPTPVWQRQERDTWLSPMAQMGYNCCTRSPRLFPAAPSASPVCREQAGANQQFT